MSNETPTDGGAGDEVVTVRRYNDEMSARIAAMVLEANGVPAHVLADTAGGMLPSMAFVFPIRLLVRAEDEALARELLDGAGQLPEKDHRADA